MRGHRVSFFESQFIRLIRNPGMTGPDSWLSPWSARKYRHNWPGFRVLLIGSVKKCLHSHLAWLGMFSPVLQDCFQQFIHCDIGGIRWFCIFAFGLQEMAIHHLPKRCTDFRYVQRWYLVNDWFSCSFHGCLVYGLYLSDIRRMWIAKDANIGIGINEPKPQWKCMWFRV